MMSSKFSKSDVLAFCQNLSKDELAALLNSAQQPPEEKKGPNPPQFITVNSTSAETCSSLTNIDVNGATELICSRHNKFDRCKLGEKVVIKLKHVYFPSNIKTMDTNSRSILNGCYLDGLVVGKLIGMLVVQVLVEADVRLQLTPSQCQDTLFVGSRAIPKTKDYRSCEMLHALRDSDLIAEREEYALIVSLLRNCDRLDPMTQAYQEKKISCIPSSPISYQSDDIGQQHSVPSSSSKRKGAAVDNDDHKEAVVSCNPRFVAARVGDEVLVRLSKLCSSRQYKAKRSLLREEDWLRWTVETTIIRKDRTGVDLWMPLFDLTLRLSPNCMKKKLAGKAVPTGKYLALSAEHLNSLRDSSSYSERDQYYAIRELCLSCPHRLHAAEEVTATAGDTSAGELVTAVTLTSKRAKLSVRVSSDDDSESFSDEDNGQSYGLNSSYANSAGHLAAPTSHWMSGSSVDGRQSNLPSRNHSERGTGAGASSYYTGWNEGQRHRPVPIVPLKPMHTEAKPAVHVNMAKYADCFGVGSTTSRQLSY